MSTLKVNTIIPESAAHVSIAETHVTGNLAVTGNISYDNAADASLIIDSTAHNVRGKNLLLSAGSVIAGTTSDISGGIMTIRGGQSKGDSGGGNILLQTSNPAAASGNSLNAYVGHLVLSASLPARSSFDSVVDYRRNTEFVTTNKTLTHHDSGKLILFAGNAITITLPDSGILNNVGCWFTFFSATGASANPMHKMVCADTTNEQIFGSMKMYDTDTANTFTVVTASGGTFNVSSIALNGTTAGALGSLWTIVAATTDQWFITQSEIIHTGTANGDAGQFIFRESQVCSRLFLKISHFKLETTIYYDKLSSGS